MRVLISFMIAVTAKDGSRRHYTRVKEFPLKNGATLETQISQLLLEQLNDFERKIAEQEGYLPTFSEISHCITII